LLLTEGEKDAACVYEFAHQFVDVLSLGGAKSPLTTLTARVLAKYERVYVCYDMDDAGADGAQTLRSYAAQHNIAMERVVVPEGNDVVQYFEAGGDVTQWIASTVGADVPAHEVTL